MRPSTAPVRQAAPSYPSRRSDAPAAATSTVALWQELQRRVSACVDATKEDARRAKGQARRAELVEQGAALRARVTELRRVLHAIPSHEVEAVLEARRQLTAAQDALDTCEAELEFVEGDLATTGSPAPSTSGGRLAHHVALESLAAYAGSTPLPLVHSLLRQCCEALVGAELARGQASADLETATARLRDALARSVSLESAFRRLARKHRVRSAAGRAGSGSPRGQPHPELSSLLFDDSALDNGGVDALSLTHHRDSLLSELQHLKDHLSMRGTAPHFEPVELPRHALRELERGELQARLSSARGQAGTL